MNLDEAIKILTDMGKPEFEGHTEDILAARQLGIEALESIQEDRERKDSPWYQLLPGETEE